MVRAMCGVQLKDINISHLMLMMGLNETMDQLAMANSVHWCGHVIGTEDVLVFGRALNFEVEGLQMKARPKRI